MSKNSTIRSERKFVQKIEKYLVLYDKTIECYSEKNDVDEAWNEIADYMGISVSECKKKWNIIRESLKRNRNEKKNTTKKNVKYNYLVPHLKFIVPFIKENKASKSSEEDEGSIDDDNEIEEMGDLDRLHKANRRQKKYKYSESNNENPELSFLRSLLPDLELMNTRQKQKFKIGVLNLINDIHGQCEDYSEKSNSNLRISEISEQRFAIKEEDT